MPRISGGCAARRAALVADIHSSSMQRGAALARLLPHLTRASGGARGIGLMLAPTLEEPVTEQLHVSGFEAASCRRALVAALAANPLGVPPILPLSPMTRDRNTVAVLHLEQGALSDGAASLASSLGVIGEHALRLVLCDGACPLAWIALFQHGPFGVREEQLVSSLVDPLCVRLRLERQVADAPFTAAALHAALEAIAAPAFLLDATGRVVRLNTAARACLSRNPRVREELRACAHGRAPAHFSVTRLTEPGAGGHVLAVAPEPNAGLAARLTLALERWHLTPRQGEVLARVAQGSSNKSVAMDLDCAESTVEVHVSALLAKAACESRAEMVARFWSDFADSPS